MGPEGGVSHIVPDLFDTASAAGLREEDDLVKSWRDHQGGPWRDQPQIPTF